MKVGDVVVRAYPQQKIIPGIIIEQVQQLDFGDDYDHGAEIDFLVHWSDGTQSIENLYELDPLELVLKYEAEGIEPGRYLNADAGEKYM